LPLYEYRCNECGRKFSALIGVTAEPDDESCPGCGSKNATRLVSRFRRGRSEDDRIDELADRMDEMGEPESPSEMRRIVRDMGAALDEDASDEMEELFEEDMRSEPDERP
jgi:putative FmdB family regulatory protein